MRVYNSWNSAECFLASHPCGDTLLAKCTNSSTRDVYRPITLTCCFAKILEKLPLNRIHPLIDPSLDECQAGFRWGSDLQAYSLMETLRLRGSSTTFCAFLDIRKALDVAWRDGALLRLFRAGVQGSDWHLSDDLISDRTARAMHLAPAPCMSKFCCMQMTLLSSAKTRQTCKEL